MKIPGGGGVLEGKTEGEVQRIFLGGGVEGLCNNRPFPSCPWPLFQNESWRTIIHVKMSLICMTINVQVKLSPTGNC